MEITPLTFLCVYVFNTGLCHKHTDLYTYATNNLQSSNKAGSDAGDSFWFSPPCNDNHSGLDPIWAWTYSQLHRAPHSVSISIFTRMFEESRHRASVTVTWDCSQDILLLKLVDESRSTSHIRWHPEKHQGGEMGLLSPHHKDFC